MKKALVLVTFGTLSVAASAQVTAIGPFTGDAQESFGQYTQGPFVPNLPNAFNGMGEFNQINSGQGLNVTSGWSFFCGISAHTAPAMMAGTGNIIVEWVFNVPATKVGGYFTTNADVPGAIFRFYDENNTLLGTETAESPLCDWRWSGWEATGNPIKRIEVESVHIFGGHIMHDDLEATFGASGCYADCDGSGSLDFFDFLCFQNEFAGGTAYADCDGSGSLDFFDFLCFQNEFAAGCP